jgi:hypothetical protein
MTSPTRGGPTLSVKIRVPNDKTPRRAMLRSVIYGTIVVAAVTSCTMIGYSLGVSIVASSPVASSVVLAPDRRDLPPPPPPRRQQQQQQQQSQRRQPQSSSPEARRGVTKGWSRTPDKWERMTLGELRKYYACSEYAKDQTKTLPTLEDWMFLKKQYRELIDDKPVILDSPVSPQEGYSFGLSDDGETPPPYYADRSEGKGRGLFASRRIKRGELVHDGPRSNVMFPDAASFRLLVVSLPRKTACDITEWAWTQSLEKVDDGKLRIFVDLNIAALMNSSRGKPNIAPVSETTTRMYATRDIEEGEEILYNYGVYSTDWDAVGLGY